MDTEKEQMNLERDKEFEKLFQETYSDIRRYVKKHIKEKNLIEDIVQETFLTAYKNFDKLQNHPNKKGWLIKTARYLIQNTERKIKKWELLPIDAKDMELPSKELEFDLAEIETMIESLEPQERELFRKHILWNYSIKDIAEEAGVSENYIRVKLYRLCKKWKIDLNFVLLVSIIIGICCR